MHAATNDGRDARELIASVCAAAEVRWKDSGFDLAVMDETSSNSVGRGRSKSAAPAKEGSRPSLADSELPHLAEKKSPVATFDDPATAEGIAKFGLSLFALLAEDPASDVVLISPLSVDAALSR